jgi:hypothetical protein
MFSDLNNFDDVSESFHCDYFGQESFPLINSTQLNNETFSEIFCSEENKDCNKACDECLDVVKKKEMNEKLKYEENILNMNKFFEIKILKKRGRQSTQSRKMKHINSSFDNMQTKIQVHFISFIVNVSNDALHTELGVNNYNFKDISYEIKRNIRQDYIERLKNSPISDILKLRISKKFKNFDKYINYETLNKVCQLSEWLNDFFKINYLIFFKYYYNNCIKLAKITFKGKDIILSKKTKSFYDLLERTENKDIRNKLIDTLKSVYFYGYDSLIEKNSFMSAKKGNELIE